MNKINILKSKFLSLDQYQELMSFCSSNLERISNLAPSDNDINIFIERTKNNKFKAIFKMASINLSFKLQSLSMNPFMAVDMATSQALNLVKKWSANKQIL
ncbi:MAG: hypothetical protein K1X29_05185 [Bdellovibrionales bacterium]|nr:hypothetical protein [Bdellovibrionales bacterium]